VWIAARVRQNRSDWCRENSDHPSAKAFPINQSGRQIQLYDPKTKQVTTVDTCFGTHHINFDYNDTLWFSWRPVEGWFNTRCTWKRKTRRRRRAGPRSSRHQRHGKRDDYVARRAVDLRRQAINARSTPLLPVRRMAQYGERVLACRLRRSPGPGAHPESTHCGILEVPFKNRRLRPGFAPRGMDVDSNDVVWTVLSRDSTRVSIGASVKVAERTRCGDRTALPEGWTLYNFPGPNYKGR